MLIAVMKQLMLSSKKEKLYFLRKIYPFSFLWYLIGVLLTPFLPFYLRWRQTQGKEYPDRVREKMGFSTCQRPVGLLIWFHVASVGELVSVFPLVKTLFERKPSLSILITTCTLTAADMLAQSFSHPRLIHQFMPLDTPRWVHRFLHFWRPEIAVFTESELWPNMLGLCYIRAIPIVLVNARMSSLSFHRWQYFPTTIKKILQCFTWISAQTTKDAQRLIALGAHKPFCVGDLKTVSPPLPVNIKHYTIARNAVADRPVFLAASTHSGEEEQIIHAVHYARKTIPNILAIIVPRHPHRGHEIVRLLGSVPQRSLGQFPTVQDTFWIGDTLGELGLFFRLASCVFMGNSLPPCIGGGHNPYEPARLNCAIASGPLIDNFLKAFHTMQDSVTIVHNATHLAHWIEKMLCNSSERNRLAVQAMKTASSHENLPSILANRILSLASHFQ